MESLEAYFQRKREELHFLASLLARPPALPELQSIDAVVELKFRLGAALKAERALTDWCRTETNWTAEGQSYQIGPYDLYSSYQRADLTIAGPPIYRRFDCAGYREMSTIYAGSGMSSISTLLLALGRLLPGARLIAPAGAYSETLEAVVQYGGALRLDQAPPALGSPPTVASSRKKPRILLIDSSAPRRPVLPSRDEKYDLIVVDTTCLSARSARARRVLRWAAFIEAPIVLVRSHTKLDSLGLSMAGWVQQWCLRRPRPTGCGSGGSSGSMRRLNGPFVCSAPPRAGLSSALGGRSSLCFVERQEDRPDHRQRTPHDAPPDPIWCPGHILPARAVWRASIVRPLEPRRREVCGGPACRRSAEGCASGAARGQFRFRLLCHGRLPGLGGRRCA
jgi:hypothetical protein